jgi:hypothetical protein
MPAGALYGVVQGPTLPPPPRPHDDAHVSHPTRRLAATAAARRRSAANSFKELRSDVATKRPVAPLVGEREREKTMMATDLRTGRPMLAGLAAAAVMLALAGCTPQPTPTPTGLTPIATTTTPSQSVTTPSLSPAQQSLENAKARVILLWATYDRLLTDPKSKINDLDTMVGDEVFASLQYELNITRAAGEVQQGSSVVVVQSAVASGATSLVTVCIDRSKAHIIEPNGKPMSPAPAPRGQRRATVEMVGGYLKITRLESLGEC